MADGIVTSIKILFVDGFDTVTLDEPDNLKTSNPSFLVKTASLPENVVPVTNVLVAELPLNDEASLYSTTPVVLFLTNTCVSELSLECIVVRFNVSPEMVPLTIESPLEIKPCFITKFVRHFLITFPIQ